MQSLAVQLLYTAEMKRPVAEPYESKAAAVDEVLRKLALETCKCVLDQLVGGVACALLWRSP